MDRSRVIALTPGEPAGIGPDVAVLLAHQLGRRIPACTVVLIADPDCIKQRAQSLGLSLHLPYWQKDPGSSKGIHILPIKTACPVTPGKLSKDNVPYVIETLERAVAGCLSGEFNALVTGPVHKGIINDAGLPFTGHTEFLAKRCGSRKVVMMLMAGGLRFGRSRHPGRSRRPASRDIGTSMCGTYRNTSTSLRVALATTHVPLTAVSENITNEHLTGVIRILHGELQAKFAIKSPRILVCGLNPHAGESGHLGREEIDTITPVIERLNKEGLSLTGPVPADTAFIPARLKHADVVLAMYHDQGLTVLKHSGFGNVVNITLGLPFIRTSVDHGTALERAGGGGIDNGSLQAALETALGLIRKG